MSNTNEILTVKVPGFKLPPSELLSQETLAGLTKGQEDNRAMVEALASGGSIQKDTLAEDIANIRQRQAEAFYQLPVYKNLTEQYKVIINTEIIAGVTTEIFTPVEGISSANRDRVLLHCHGGAFTAGSRTFSHLESIPVAALGHIKVVSVDYRMAPEHHFPAATDDVVAVYKTLLKDYQPENIGLYGASAGAVLSAQTLVRLQQLDIPLPCAVGMIAAGTTKFVGDSVEIVSNLFKATEGADLKVGLQLEYYSGANLDNPELTPALCDQFISAFPPSLLVSSTRDFQLSSVLVTHRQLLGLGVEAELHVWEGLDHLFHYNPRLPESEELNRVVVQFFEKHFHCDA